MKNTKTGVGMSVLKTGFLIGFASLLVTVWAFADVGIQLRATVAPMNEISVVGEPVVPQLGGIVPSGPFDPLVSSAPWHLAAPIVVTLNVSNNTTNKLVIYTDHRRSQDFKNTTSIRLSPSTQINGLINFDQINDTNVDNCSVPLRAWTNIDHIPTVNESTIPDSAWTWITDISSGVEYTELMQGRSFINDAALPVYIRMSWNAGKISGDYRATIFISIISQ